MLGTFMFAEFVGTQLRLLRLVREGLFAVGSLWSLLRTTSKQFLSFLSIFLFTVILFWVVLCCGRLVLLRYS
jgi:hypothetical protein